ncbi:hypothetical protein [Calidifontibacter indicus]|uniref:Core-binding (CB) domain-containing protein n=1 Tax=Calidifontibacter indicus TaxID=419650 RepID=A0A3D9UTN8_9MICO|nr:hypothetical protein [Calidifontibacter indicus]REF31340.1 hypothetical protein DFJ65_2400 [Calidifontibacter indicus]
MVDEARIEALSETAAHFVQFLDWAEAAGELPSSTIQNWRNASVKVLQIEDDWPHINVVKFDLDGHLSRFDVLKRGNYTSGSMAAYKARTRNAIETYRKWLADPNSADWKKRSGAGRSSQSDEVGLSDTTEGNAPGVGSSISDVDRGFVPDRITMIEYPLPLRAGVQARLWLPEDLDEVEAKRIGRFVDSLVFNN